MKSFLEKLNSGVVLLSDGGMGTELQKRGMPTRMCPEELSVSRPDIVQGIYRDYFEAGSDIVETNTFGGNRSRLALHSMADRVAEFCEESANLARSVCPAGKFVAGSMGPTGDLLEPFGERRVQDAYEIFAEQAAALAQGGVDVLFVETMMAVEEAEVAVRAAKEKTGLPVVATMTFELSKAGMRTTWGVDIPAAVERLTHAGADVLGANCGRGFDDMIEVIKEMRPLTTKPLIAQANAGMPEWIDGVAVYTQTPESLEPKAERLLQLGVNILGGCCGTGPEHIRMMRGLVDSFNAPA